MHVRLGDNFFGRESKKKGQLIGSERIALHRIHSAVCPPAIIRCLCLSLASPPPPLSHHFTSSPNPFDQLISVRTDCERRTDKLDGIPKKENCSPTEKGGGETQNAHGTQKREGEAAAPPPPPLLLFVAASEFVCCCCCCCACTFEGSLP